MVCVAYDADQKGVVLPWSVLAGPFALLAAGALGVAVGMTLRGAWVVPVIVIAVFLAHRVTYWSVLPELFTLKQATGSAANGGYRQLGWHLVASCLVNALAAAALLSWSCYVVRPRGLRPRVFLAVAGLGIAAIALVLGWGWTDSYEVIPL